MGAKKILVAGMLAATTTFASYSGSYAQNQTDKAGITQSAETKSIVEKVLKNVFNFHYPYEIGSTRYDKENNKLSIFDLRMNLKQMSIVYDRIDINNYKENTGTGAFSIDKIVANGSTITFSKEYLEKLDETFKTKQSPAPKFPSTPIKLGTLSYSGISVSAKKHTISVESGTMKGIDLGPESPVDFSTFQAEFKNYSVKSTDRLKKLSDDLLELSATPKSGKPAPEDAQKLLSLVIDLYSLISIESMTMSGLPEIPDPKNGNKIKFSKIVLKNLKDGVLGEVGIKGFSMEPGDKRVLQSFYMDEFSILNFSYPKIAEIVGHLLQNPNPDPMLAAQWVQVFAGVAIKGLKIETPTQTIQSTASMTWEKFVGLFPTDINWKGHSVITPPKGDKAVPAPQQGPVAPPQDAMTMLKAVGLDKLDLKYDARLSWDAKTNKVTLAPFIYDANKLFVLDFSASIGGITEGLLKEQDPQKLLILALGSTMGPIKLELTDKGVQKIYELQANGMWEAVSAPFAQDPKLKPVVDNMSKLLNAPNGKFTLVLKPKGTVSTSQFSGALALDPFSALSLFDIESTYELKK